MFKVLNEQEIQEPTGCSYFIRWLLYYINILIHIHPLELCFVDSQSLSCKKSNLAELGQKVLYDDLRRLEQVTKADGSFQKNHYDAEGLRAEMEENGQLVKFLYNEDREAVAEEESDGNVIRYIRGLGLIYYLRARYYNPVIAGFTQEDTYYGDGLNLYTYCQNNPILYHDPTGHGTKENSPYSRNEQQYIDVGADPDTARLAAQCYPDAKSKQDLYNKYKKQGYSAQDAKKLANREIIHGEEATKKYIKDNNVKKSGPGYTATSPRDNVNTDWRTQERVNAQRNAGAGKGNESGNKSGSFSKGVGNPVEVVGRGSTGRTVPNTLNEQMAMHQVMSNPLEGAVDMSQMKNHPVIMSDSRWLASEGWVKMSNNVNGVEIHFVYNKITGAFDDFKFKQENNDMNDKILYKDSVSLLSFESLYCIGGYVTFEILVSTSGFAGNCNFCIGEKIIQDYTNCLDTMISLLDGEVIVRDCESDAFLKFYFENNMNLYVLGQIGGSHEDNMLKFKMKADQTLLLGLKNSLLDY